MASAEDCDREQVEALLSSPEAYGDNTKKVDVVVTHGAKVFLGKRHVYKIKLPVNYDYMDFSTLERRRAACQREIELNRRTAPDIYLGLIRITRMDSGELMIGGTGEIVEWAVHMKRFPEADVLSNVAKRGDLNKDMATRLGRQIALYHLDLPQLEGEGGTARIREIIDELNEAFKQLPDGGSRKRAEHFQSRSEVVFEICAPLLDRRAGFGLVRRCHGDLHLRNIVLLDGQPTPFDALEFSERFATTDVLYDLAFLIMDMIHAGLKAEANTAFNRYIYFGWSLFERHGFSVFPLFLSLRAAIRAMVEEQARSIDEQASTDHKRESDTYLIDALNYLEPQQAMLIAVGGLSGSGKSTVAADLAPELGLPPGAFLLRSDLERKKMMGAEELDHLSPDAYNELANRHVYERLFDKARIALAQGWPVVIDAAFISPVMRRFVRKLAWKARVPFRGLWLEAPDETLIERVRKRRDDASDADVNVVQKQLRATSKRPFDEEDSWVRVDASGVPRQSLNHAREALKTISDNRWQANNGSTSYH